MSAAVETAYAKLNLALHVRRRLDDGYHALETLFAFCADGDTLAIGDAPGLTITGPFGDAITADEDNLVLRAQRAFAARFGAGDETGFILDKRLPVAAGIGGGSADAAAALRLLAMRHGQEATSAAMLAIAAGLGADVPACLLSQPMRGDGRGDRLTPVANPFADQPVLLVNPRQPLATGPVFAAWDRVDRGGLAEIGSLADACIARNDLEAPARGLLPLIGDVLDLLAAQPGTQLVRMSGSGATCFVLFEDDASRDAAEQAVAAARPDWWRLATRLR